MARSCIYLRSHQCVRLCAVVPFDKFKVTLVYFQKIRAVEPSFPLRAYRLRERSFLPHACSSLIIDIACIVRRCYRISVTATDETVNYLLDTNGVYEYRRPIIPPPSLHFAHLPRANNASTFNSVKNPKVFGRDSPDYSCQIS